MERKLDIFGPERTIFFCESKNWIYQKIWNESHELSKYGIKYIFFVQFQRRKLQDYSFWFWPIFQQHFCDYELTPEFHPRIVRTCTREIVAKTVKQSNGDPNSPNGSLSTLSRFSNAHVALKIFPLTFTIEASHYINLMESWVSYLISVIHSLSYLSFSADMCGQSAVLILFHYGNISVPSRDQCLLMCVTKSLVFFFSVATESPLEKVDFR